MIWRLVGIGVILSVIGALLGELGSKERRVFGALGCVLLFLAVMPEITSIVGEAQRIAELGTVSDGASVCLKIVGVGYLFSLCASMAEEMGERGIAQAITFAARVEIAIIIIPYFREIVNMGMELLK